MIPVFPQFKRLELSDKADIERLTKQFLPFSDFNFTSLWAWDTNEEVMISNLFGNLVLRFTDYITSQPFYTFLGISSVNETAQTLFNKAEQENIMSELRMVPEATASLLDKNRFDVVESEDHHDYVFEMIKLQNFDGNRLRSKRNLCNRFKRQFTSETKVLDHLSKKAQDEILELFDLWVTNKNYSANEADNERKAFQRLFLMNNHDLVCIGVYIAGKLKGLIINEILAGHYTMLHFEKADEKFEGIYAYLMSENARILNQVHKRTYLNYEQDLGLPGLRLGKRSYRPSHTLKKYTIRRK